MRNEIMISFTIILVSVLYQQLTLLLSQIEPWRKETNFLHQLQLGSRDGNGPGMKRLHSFCPLYQSKATPGNLPTNHPDAIIIKVGIFFFFFF
jgi:hypothetical protein